MQKHFFNTAYSGKITFICEYFASGISKICFNRIFFVIIQSAYKICWWICFNIQSAIEGWKSKQPIFFWKAFHRGKLSHLQNFNRIFNGIPLKFNRIFNRIFNRFFNRNSMFFQSNFQVWGNSFYWKKHSKFKFQSNFQSWTFSIFLLKFFNRGCSGKSLVDHPVVDYRVPNAGTSVQAQWQTSLGLCAKIISWQGQLQRQAIGDLVENHTLGPERTLGRMFQHNVETQGWFRGGQKTRNILGSRVSTSGIASLMRQASSKLFQRQYQGIRPYRKSIRAIS